MLTTALAFCGHTLNSYTGSELVHDFLSRFNGVAQTAEGDTTTTDWSLALLYAGDTDGAWKKNKQLEFYRLSDDSDNMQYIIFREKTAELGVANIDSWTTFVNDLMNFPTLNLRDDYWQSYRRDIYKLMKNIGGKYVLFIANTHCQSLLYSRPAHLYDTYPVEEMIAAAKRNRMSIFRYPVTEQQFNKNKDPTFGILIDDFADLR